MIERKFVEQKLKEFQIQEYISDNMKKVGHSKTKLQKTPLGEKIIIHASRPGLVVGRKGENIKKVTKILKKRFNLENPQIEISEVEDQTLDVQIVTERIANSMERFGTSKFKAIGHKTMSEVMAAGALGIEILISGKIPGSRAKRWRFYQGYLKKCGDVSLGVLTSYKVAKLKTGIVGIQVRIMPPDIKLPDDVQLLEEKQEVIEEIKKETKETKQEKKETKKEKPTKKEVKRVKETKETKPKENGNDKTK